MRFPFFDRFLTADIEFENAAQFRRVLLINAILSFATVIFLFFGFYNLAIGVRLIAVMDFLAAAFVFGAIVDLRVNKNVVRAGDAGIWSLFFFFISFVYVNEGREFGLIWTIFFPVFVFLIRSRSGVGHVLLFYAALFMLAYANIGVWQEGQWTTTGFIRLAVASTLLSYVAYVSERARNRSDQKNDELLAREKAYSAQLREYQAELEERVSKTLSDLSDREKIILRNAQMAEMGSLIGVIAHQLKQPLTALSLLDDELGDVYRHGELDASFMQQHNAVFEQQIDHMSRTVDDFRNFFNPNKQKKPFLLAKAVHKTVDLMTPQLQQHKITIRFDLDDSIELFGFESELLQAIVNILNNAKDAIITRRITAPLITVACFYSPDRQRAVLQIEDNGGGIDEAVLGRIFDFYFTTKADTGTGIGLYLVRKIVSESFGGSVQAENIKEGARFTLFFPLSA